MSMIISTLGSGVFQGNPLSQKKEHSTEWKITTSQPVLPHRQLECIALFSTICCVEKMDERPQKQAKILKSTSEEVSSIEWEFIKMTEQEEDLVYRIYRLVGDRWDLIAGRIPERTAEEIERFWIMRHGEMFADKRNEEKAKFS
ncbi:transcription factor CPC-like isoform X1 [Herrania umbratica]|uniref:Transcription factor CPC-like isoform X1 n=2 Tax=Herrania umbratica TaxID=108875 RepID=A0A6J1ACY4_9ROSI|nr:transcription factor CPC-like isoform X1 [Herrania umbratica]